MTSPIFNALRTSPSDMTSHDKGFAIAKTRIVGASSRKIVAAAFHLGYRVCYSLGRAGSAQNQIVAYARQRLRDAKTNSPCAAGN